MNQISERFLSKSSSSCSLAWACLALCGPCLCFKPENGPNHLLAVLWGFIVPLWDSRTSERELPPWISVFPVVFWHHYTSGYWNVPGIPVPWGATAFLVLQETKGLICCTNVELKWSHPRLLALSLFQRWLFPQQPWLSLCADLLLSQWHFQLCVFAHNNPDLNVNTLIAWVLLWQLRSGLVCGSARLYIRSRNLWVWAQTDRA